MHRLRVGCKGLSLGIAFRFRIWGKSVNGFRVLTKREGGSYSSALTNLLDPRRLL